ncbi:MAG: hypothetical protein WC841_02775 [Candidatus Shapirobacteria bacterium]|jgi:hypothetical protein
MDDKRVEQNGIAFLDQYAGWAKNLLPPDELRLKWSVEMAIDAKLKSWWQEIDAAPGLLFQDVLTLTPVARRQQALEQADIFASANIPRKKEAIVSRLMAEGNVDRVLAEEQLSTTEDKIQGQTYVAKNIYSVERLIDFLQTGELWGRGTIQRPEVQIRALEAKLGTRAMDIAEDPSVLYGILTDDWIEDLTAKQPFFSDLGVYLIGSRRAFERKTIFCDVDSGSQGGLGMHPDVIIQSHVFNWEGAELARVYQKLFPGGWYVESHVMGGWKPEETEKIVITKDIFDKMTFQQKEMVLQHGDLLDKVFVLIRGQKNNIILFKDLTL